MAQPSEMDLFPYWFGPFFKEKQLHIWRWCQNSATGGSELCTMKRLQSWLHFFRSVGHFLHISHKFSGGNMLKSSIEYTLNHDQATSWSIFLMLAWAAHYEVHFFRTTLPQGLTHYIHTWLYITHCNHLSAMSPRPRKWLSQLQPKFPCHHPKFPCYYQGIHAHHGDYYCPCPLAEVSMSRR